METDHTRTAVTDEGTFAWSAGDQVWLHTTSGSVVGTLSSGAGSHNATFSFGSHIGELTGMAVYPYNPNHAISGEVPSFVLPDSYALGASLYNTNAAMYGVNVGGTIKFNHLAGVMRFKFKNVPAGVNKFMITLDKKINGVFAASLNADYIVIEAEETSVASEKTITLNFDALTKVSDISLYVPLPVGIYNTLQLGLYANSEPVWTYSNTVTNTISRKSLKLMPTVTISGQVDGDIEDGETPEEPAEYDYIDEYGTNNGPGIQIGETTWTPVNCGYHKDDFKYGKLYQWGRKYGQGYEGDLYDVNDNKSGTYSDATVPAIEEGGVSVVLVHIPKQFLGYSFQLPATAATLATMPTFEVTSATIGLQGRTIPTPAASASTAEMSAWASTAAVRTGTLSVAFRQPTKSLSFSGE